MHAWVFLSDLGVCSDGSLALGAGVGADFVKALGAHMLVVLLDELLAVQVVATVEAVKALRHGGGQVASGACQKNNSATSLLCVGSR